MRRVNLCAALKIFLYLMILIFPIVLNAQTFWVGQNSGTTQDLNSIDFYDEYNGLIAGDNGLILKTFDGGNTWESATSGTSNNLNGVSFVDADTAVVVGDGPTILRTIDGGESWISITSGVYGNLISVDIDISGNGLAGGTDQTILRTDDAGATWIITQTGYMGGGWQGAQMVDGSVGFVFGSNSIFQPFVGKTTNSGTNFSFYNFYFVQGPVSNEGKLFDGYFFDDLNGITAGRRWDGYGCISSTSNLNNWATLHYPTPFYGVDFSSVTDGYVVGANGTILHTTDGGTVWESEDSGVFSQLNSVVLLNESLGFVVGNNGVILKKQDNTIYVSGDVSGIWSADTVKVVGELTIPAGETLTIEPGTIVEFQGHYKFNVQGQILALGTEQDSIIFTVADTTGYSTNSHIGWHGTRFDNTPATNDSSKFYYCHFEYGKAVGTEYEDKQGGAIYLKNYSKVHIARSRFYYNYASYGGAIYCGFCSSPLIELNDISFNSGIGENPGYTGWGGGLLIEYDSSPIIRSNRICYNYGYFGAGVCCNMNPDPNIFIENNVISHNSGNEGAGILISSSAVTILNNLVSSNSSDLMGGGISCFYETTSIDMINNTITENTAQSGGGIAFFNEADLPLINNNIWGNIASDGSQIYLYEEGTNPNFYNCNIEGGVAAFGGEGAAGFSGDYESCIDADPLYVDPENGDFHLQDSSPCIGAGIDEIEVNGTWYYAPEFDIEGNPRPNPAGSMPDIGAYENPFGEPQSGVIENCILKIEDCVLSNYPNPFNPSTTISFELSTETSENTELVIYNLKGQKVKVLECVNRVEAKARDSLSYSVTWDGTDENDKPVSSEIYFYKLKTRDFEKTKRMLLLK